MRSPPALPLQAQSSGLGRSTGGSGWKPEEQMPGLLPPPAACAGSPRGEQLLGTKGANYVAKLSPWCNWAAAADANEGLVQAAQMSLLQTPPGKCLFCFATAS